MMKSKHSRAVLIPEMNMKLINRIRLIKLTWNFFHRVPLLLASSQKFASIVIYSGKKFSNPKLLTSICQVRERNRKIEIPQR